MSTGAGEDRDLPVDHHAAWRTTLWTGLIAYVASRIVVAVAVGVVVSTNTAATTGPQTRPASALRAMRDVLASWDGAWYLAIARDGYPKAVPATLFSDGATPSAAARAAFFPLYPTLVRGLDTILPGGDVGVAILLNTVLGAVVVVLVGVLARSWFDIDVARRSMILVALCPGSFVFSFAYSETVLLLCACACLIFLDQRRWAVAGLAALLGGLARPNGLALTIACAVAAVVAIRDKREWRSLVAPAIAPLGVLGFHLYLWRRTDEWGVWFRVQRQAWDEGYSWGWSTVTRVVDTLTDPLHSPTNLLCTLTIAALIGIVVTRSWQRLPLPAIAYSAAIVVLMLVPQTVTARPRFLLTAFPLLIGFAAWWPRARDEAWGYLVAISSTALLAVTMLYAGRAAVP